MAGSTVLIDEDALRECVESNLYQSSEFGAGAKLGRALVGDQSVSDISPRVALAWGRGVLFVLRSRAPTRCLLIDGRALAGALDQDTVLHMFQRICRFALKVWGGNRFTSGETWSQRTDCGVVFPFPYSTSRNRFRITVMRGYSTARHEKRHGGGHLFAFAGGTSEARSENADEQVYNKAFNELTKARQTLETQLESREEPEADLGYHSLVLSDPNHGHIKYQSYEQWLGRLTSAQLAFVESAKRGPQRVEGPAGTGKTLCLLLRANYLCMYAQNASEECRLLFVAHSAATRDSILTALDAVAPNGFHRCDGGTATQSIRVCTLQEWCGELLGSREITNAQYLDQDALAAKEMRKLLIQDVVTNRRESDPDAFGYLSDECRAFFLEEEPEYVADLLQHEIGVLIKGRASESSELYLALPRPSYCLPLRTENDRRFVFSLYRQYQREINDSGVYDTDDIVLTTLGRLNTPIWRRRRSSEGYTAIVVDETHLFNLNELSVFHMLLRNASPPTVIFSIDRSQAPGERGFTTQLVRDILVGEPAGGDRQHDQEVRTSLVFRSSPQIVRLAEAVTNVGATLFTTFENPLVDVSSVISATDEAVATPALCWRCTNDQAMCSWASTRVKALSNQLKCPPSDILVVASTPSLLEQLKGALADQQQPTVVILRRGDLSAVVEGQKRRAVILSCPDFVGGLEFKAVVIAGVDEGRFPPVEGVRTEESRHFIEFRACNQLYVAITRARLAVELLYSGERGPSPLLNHAISSEVIDTVDAGQ